MVPVCLAEALVEVLVCLAEVLADFLAEVLVCLVEVPA